MTAEFRYGTMSPEFTEQVLSAYRRFGSCKRVSTELPVSSATVSRVVRAAVECGAMSPEEKQSSGRPLVNRELILTALEQHPDVTILGLAGMLDISDSTIYRALRGE